MSEHILEDIRMADEWLHAQFKDESLALVTQKGRPKYFFTTKGS